MAKQPSKKTARKAAAKKAVKKAAKKAIPARKAPAQKTATARKAPAKKAAVKKTVAKKAAAKKAAARKPEPVKTTIIARYDAGFGNELFLRGGGAGLGWEKGVLMTNTQPDEWVWESTAVTGELEFKVLLNDSEWSEGQNGIVFPGATVVFEPIF